MTRTRLSTTVDETLLNDARGLRSGMTDAALIDEALAALLARHRGPVVRAAHGAIRVSTVAGNDGVVRRRTDPLRIWPAGG